MLVAVAVAVVVLLVLAVLEAVELAELVMPLVIQQPQTLAVVVVAVPHLVAHMLVVMEVLVFA
jgi:hypothetical protein